MYNGIGILTPRGSGTSGHVQTNKFNLRPGAAHRVDRVRQDDNGPTQRQPNKGIIDHNRKRDIELEIAKLEEKLLNEEMSLEDIAVAVEKRRAELLAQTEASQDPWLHSAGKKPTDETHEVAQRKIEQMGKLKTALGLSEVKEGDAFNRELQEERRQQKIQEREEKEKAREKEKKMREKEAKKRAKEAKAREKERVKEQKRKEKELAKAREEWQARRAESDARRAQGRDGRYQDDYRDRRPAYGEEEDRHYGRPGPPQDGGRWRDQAPRVYRKHEQPPDRYEPGAEADDERWQGGPYDDEEDHDRADYRARERLLPAEQRRSRQEAEGWRVEDRGRQERRHPGDVPASRAQAAAEPKALKKVAPTGKKPSKASRSSSSSSSGSGSSSSGSSGSSSSGSSSDSSSSSDSEAEAKRRRKPAGAASKAAAAAMAMPPPPSRHVDMPPPPSRAVGKEAERGSKQMRGAAMDEEAVPAPKRPRHDSPEPDLNGRHGREEERKRGSDRSTGDDVQRAGQGRMRREEEQEDRGREVAGRGSQRQQSDARRDEERYQGGRDREEPELGRGNERSREAIPVEDTGRQDRGRQHRHREDDRRDAEHAEDVQRGVTRNGSRTQEQQDRQPRPADIREARDAAHADRSRGSERGRAAVDRSADRERADVDERAERNRDLGNAEHQRTGAQQERGDAERRVGRDSADTERRAERERADVRPAGREHPVNGGRDSAAAGQERAVSKAQAAPDPDRRQRKRRSPSPSSSSSSGSSGSSSGASSSGGSSSSTSSDSRG